MIDYLTFKKIIYTANPNDLRESLKVWKKKKNYFLVYYLDNN